MKANLLNAQLIKPRQDSLTIVEQIFYNRDIDKKDIPLYLNTPDSVVNDPSKLDNINDAKETFLRHYENKSPILIQVDSDADGYTSSAILYNYLTANYPEINLSYQIHFKKEHGLEMTDSVREGAYPLIFIPDAGTNERQKHETLCELGVEIIVLDHHESDEVSEYAIIVNNQLSSDYPNKALSGAGVVYQFCRLLDRENEFNIHKTCANDYLDLVAVGMVADMMPLKNLETKRLVEKGIALINNALGRTCNQFIQKLVIKNNFALKGNVTPTGIGFSLAPYINAVIRLGDLESKHLIFSALLTENENRSLPSTKRGFKEGDTETYIDQAIRIASNIKSNQKSASADYAAEFELMIDEEYLRNNSIIVIKNVELNKSLNGLIANQLCSKFQRPVMVLAEKEVGDKTILSGSARGPASANLPDFKEVVLASGLTELAEGHANAFGIEIELDKFESFIAYANEKISRTDNHKVYFVDLIIDAAELTPSVIRQIVNLQPLFGKGFEEPLILVQNLMVTNERKTFYEAKNTLKLKDRKSNINLIKFKTPKEEADLFCPNTYTATTFDIVGTCTLNTFNGMSEEQIFIKDFAVKINRPVF